MATKHPDGQYELEEKQLTMFDVSDSFGAVSAALSAFEEAKEEAKARKADLDAALEKHRAVGFRLRTQVFQQRNAALGEHLRNRHVDPDTGEVQD